MIYSRKYSRNFIPLKQDNSDYNLDFKSAVGRCLIEIKNGKGKVTVYAQGVKPSNKYNVELMCFEKGTLKNANVGILSVDEYGKGEIKADFDPDNVLNTGNPIEDFNIVALVVDGLDKVVSSLVGYVGNEVDWKNSYSINRDKKCCQPSSPILSPINNNPISPPSMNNNPINPAPIITPEIPEPPTFSPNISELEQGLIDKEAGLIERQKGLIEREESLIQKEQNINNSVDLASFERALWEKERGLLEKALGLTEKENGLLKKEYALNQGYLPTDEDMAFRDREIALIELEKALIKKEESLIQTELEILNQRGTPSSDLEKGLRERELGLIERERGLLEREKGLIQKEEGLFEKEQGIRDRNAGLRGESSVKENNINNEDSFKSMIEKLKNEVYDLDKENNINQEITLDKEYDSNEENVLYKENKDIEYIKLNNMRLTPFKNENDNISWFRISPYELIAFDKNISKCANNPFVYSSYKKYNHLMIGIKTENNTESYILGIPCQYKANFFIKDFENFVPLNENVSSNNIKDGEYGYRLLNI